MSNRNNSDGFIATRQPSNHTATWEDAQIFPNLVGTRQLGKTPNSFQTLLAFNTCDTKTTNHVGWAKRAAVP